MDLIGVSYDMYLPDKSMLGQHTEGIMLFEKAITATASLVEIQHYAGSTANKETFKLRPGHIVGLQLMGTEMRHKGTNFFNSHMESDVAITHTRNTSLENNFVEAPESDSPLSEAEIEEARAEIVTKMKRRLDEENIPISGTDITFRPKGAYLICPYCLKLAKITARKKNKKGDLRYEVFDVCRHIIRCKHRQMGQGQMFKRRCVNDTIEPEFADILNDESSVEYVQVKQEGGLLDHDDTIV